MVCASAITVFTVYKHQDGRQRETILLLESGNKGSWGFFLQVKHETEHSHTWWREEISR